jgi:hypothetical protein
VNTPGSFGVFAATMRIGPRLLETTLKKLLLLAALVGAALAASAQKSGECIQTPTEAVCAPFGGAIVSTITGPVCGPGQCVLTATGPVCAATPGGSAIESITGARCTGGCVPASRSYCVAAPK